MGDSNLQLLMQAYTDPAHAEQTELQLVRNTNTAIFEVLEAGSQWQHAEVGVQVLLSVCEQTDVIALLLSLFHSIPGRCDGVLLHNDQVTSLACAGNV